MRITFGLALITWGLLTMFAIPLEAAPKFINYVILGLYGIAIAWYAVHLHPAWTMYWLAASFITLVVTFGDLSANDDLSVRDDDLQ